MEPLIIVDHETNELCKALGISEERRIQLSELVQNWCDTNIGKGQAELYAYIYSICKNAGEFASCVHIHVMWLYETGHMRPSYFSNHPLFQFFQ